MDDRSNDEVPPELPKHVINIVWQYAPENQSHLIQQKRHLRMLSASGLIAMRDREEILAGLPMDFTHHIENADMIIALVSSHLLNDLDKCGIDMQNVFEKHLAGEVYVLSIYIGSCAYNGTPIGQLPIIRAKGKAVTHWSGDERQAAYTNAAEEIRKIVEILLTLKWKVTAEKFYEQDCYDLALEACKNSLQFYEENTSFHSDIADAALWQRFQNALVSCYILQSKLLLSFNEFEAALIACTKGIEIQAQNPFLNSNRGRILHYLNRFEEAIEAFKLSIDQFEAARKKNDAGTLYKEDLYSTYVGLARACEARAEQEKQKWLQQRDEAKRMARKLGKRES